ncbi:MAG: DUF1501 domain-containing protein, partial [Rhodoferax sp.]|nr:DUF1501 domain-containing protein [Rhodoferax sp.]
MGEAAAFASTDYKALVCVFLFGGNDYANTVVAYDDASYAKYATIRAAGSGGTNGVALDKDALAATLLKPTTALPQGRQFALNPAMKGLTNLFNTGKAAVQLNVGPLIVPLTRDQYNSSNRVKYPLPPKLFSHNDQQSVWQSSSPEGSTIGWGGKMGDVALSNNSDSLFTCISLSGNSVLLAGDSALQYQCSTSGAIAVRNLSNNFFYQTEIKNAFAAMLQQPRKHVLENEYNTVMKRGITAQAKVAQGLSTVQLQTAFPAANALGNQLKMVAQLIGARNSLGAKRQVFMVSLGGFDLHDYLNTKHAPLLQQIDDALSAFYQATVELGVADKVTAFTASDFGRTLASNGDGSDHGWGSHHLMVGGAVKGAAFYGTAPPISITDTMAPDDQWHVGQGRLLPSTSVDQYAATLAKWFGVADSEMGALLPNLKNFGVAAGRPDYPTNLGFM